MSYDDFLISIIEALNHPFYLIDAGNHEILLANSSSEASIGLTCFKSVHGLAAPCWHEGIQCPLELVKSTGKAVKIEHTHQDKDGKLRYYEVHASPIFNQQGELKQIIEYSFDITRQRELEEQLKKSYQEVLVHKEKAELANHLKSQFLANMSHDIRTPLHGILGFADLLLKRHNLPEKASGYVDKIKKSGQVLLTLLNDILDYSKIEAGQLDVYPQDFTIKEMFENLQGLFNQQFEDKGVLFNLVIGNDVPERIHTDRWRLHQVLENLISNAVKFTAEGKVFLSAAYRKEDDTLLLCVADTGCGIPEKYHRLIFNPFTQIHLSDRVDAKGTGLGLTISKDLAILLGGKVILESTVGVGSKFTVEIPANSTEVGTEAAPRVTDGKKETVHTGLKGAWKSSKILVAEDNQVNLELILEQLKFKGFRNLWTAANGKEAIELARKHSPDLILMDIQMPIIDGNQAIKELRESGFNQPIIAFTAYTMRDEVEKSLAAGASAVFTKPVDFNMFFKDLAQYLVKEEHQDGTGAKTDYSFIKESISQRVRQVFLEDALLKLDTLEKFLADDENGPAVEEIRKIAHNYKGNASYLGLDTLAVTATTLDSQVKNNEPIVVIRESAARLMSLIKKIIAVNYPDLQEK